MQNAKSADSVIVAETSILSNNTRSLILWLKAFKALSKDDEITLIQGTYSILALWHKGKAVVLPSKLSTHKRVIQKVLTIVRNRKYTTEKRTKAWYSEISAMTRITAKGDLQVVLSANVKNPTMWERTPNSQRIKTQLRRLSTSPIYIGNMMVEFGDKRKALVKVFAESAPIDDIPAFKRDVLIQTVDLSDLELAEKTILALAEKHARDDSARYVELRREVDNAAKAFAAFLKAQQMPESA